MTKNTSRKISRPNELPDDNKVVALPRKPDREQLSAFVRSMFKNVAGEGFVSLRSFENVKSGAPPVSIKALPMSDLQAVIDAAFKEADAAANHEGAVFAPPIATLNNKRNAREIDLVAGPVLSVELDDNATESRERLEALLGPATDVVESGGIDENGEPKLHLHFRLTKPAHGKDLELLKEARTLAAHLVGGDTTATSIVHPLRWPGSWHTKGEPVLCMTVMHTENEIDLREALAVLRKAPKVSATSNVADNRFDFYGEHHEEYYGKRVDWEALLAGLARTSVHAPIYRSNASLISGDGMSPEEAVETIKEELRKNPFCKSWNFSDRNPQWDALLVDGRKWAKAIEDKRAKEEREEARLEAKSIRPIVIKPHDFPLASTMAMFDWLYGRHLRRADVAGTAAPGGVGKSTMSISEALAMASGRALLQQEVKKPLRTLIINLEDDPEVMNKRIEAARDFHKLSVEDFGGRLSVLAKGEIDFLVATMDRGGRGVRRGDPFIKELKRVLIGEGIDVVSVDPFIRTHGVPENDNNAIKSVVTYFEEIAWECRCAISLWHHARKGKGGNNEASVDDSRGASAFVDACRSVRILELLGKEEAKKLTIDDHHRRYFHAVSGKLNYAPPVDDREWYHLANFELLNKVNPFGTSYIGGDNIGVVEKWSLPVAKAMTDGQVALIVKEVEGPVRWRDSVQAGMWVGIAVATALDLDPGKDRDGIKRTITKLIADKVLKRITAPGNDRHPTLFVVPNEMQEPAQNADTEEPSKADGKPWEAEGVSKATYYRRKGTKT